MMLKQATCLCHLVNLFSEDDIVRIAHRDERSQSDIARSHKLTLVLQRGFEHVNSDTIHLRAIEMEVENFDARQCQQADAAVLRQSAFVEILTDATAGVSAHHRLGSVGIENAHGEVGFGYRRTADQHQAVAADARVAVAPATGCLCRIGDGPATDVYIDIVVAAAMHLGERYFHFVRYSFTLMAVCLPLAIARTTSEAPFCASPQTNTFPG